MLQCAQCGFYHTEADTRCLRCGALLREAVRLDPLAAPGPESPEAPPDLRPPARWPGANAWWRLRGAAGRLAFRAGQWLAYRPPPGLHFRNPWAALALGLIPGAGQLFVRQPRRALLLGGGVWSAFALSALTWHHPAANLILLATGLLWVYTAHDAFLCAKRINRDVFHWTTAAAFYVAWGLLLCLGLLGAQWLADPWLLKLRGIAHDELAPYVRTGERIGLNRWAYLAGNPRVGDVAWVTNVDPRHPRILKLERPTPEGNIPLLVRPRNYMERVVGLPGDTFERRNGVFFRNGRAVPPAEQPLVTEQLPRDFALTAPAGHYIVLMSTIGRDALEFLGAPQDVRMDRDWIAQNWDEVNFVPRLEVEARAAFVYHPPPARRWLN